MKINTYSFPKKFLWGTATSAYQIEGAYDKDNKGLSIWDNFTNNKKKKILDHSNGNVSCNHYEHYKDDVQLMEELNLKAYRFSISWPRIFPTGKGKCNRKGISFYDRLIDELLKKKIKPFVTLFHWDLPYELEKIGGWTNREIINYFIDYTFKVVSTFQDRVKHWITINEPAVIVSAGYLFGKHAPGYTNPFKAVKAMHHLMLAHGHAVKTIKSINKNLQVGLSNAIWKIDSLKKNTNSYHFTWAEALLNRSFMDPVFKGSYPKQFMLLFNLFYRQKTNLTEDLKVISEPIDFIGVNHYSRLLIQKTWVPLIPFKISKPLKDSKVTHMGWEIIPKAFSEVLKWISKEYNNPAIYITENGAAFQDKIEKGTINDNERTQYLKKYIIKLGKSISKGINIKGYFVWSLLDNFEWEQGFTKRFGIVYVDFKNQQRIIKKSGYWYKNLSKMNSLNY